jgi:hypothetical protein
MAYAQWVSITIKPLNSDITVKNPVHEWGKFFAGSKDNEVSSESINGTIIEAGNSYTINACGRSDSASGTEGSIDLYDGKVHVGNYYWSCPWSSVYSNKSTWSSASNNHIAQVTGGNVDNSGSLGNITIKVVKV